MYKKLDEIHMENLSLEDKGYEKKRKQQEQKAK